jgi:hypothetical protein
MNITHPRTSALRRIAAPLDGAADATPFAASQGCGQVAILGFSTDEFSID